MLIDTAGRYTTQDSYEQVDKAAWRNFLDLLKKHRPRRPINGVLVAVSLSDLMQQTPAERGAHAQAIRQRIQELCQSFQIAVPVYVFFMKADLVAGFNEFFADLGKEGREQVWGVTFKLDQREGAPVPIAAFPEEMDVLSKRGSISAYWPAWSRNASRASACCLFSFPRQFNALGEVLEGFLNDAFAPSRFEIRPLGARGLFHQRHPDRHPDRPDSECLRGQLRSGSARSPALQGDGQEFFHYPPAARGGFPGGRARGRQPTARTPPPLATPWGLCRRGDDPPADRDRLGHQLFTQPRLYRGGRATRDRHRDPRSTRSRPRSVTRSACCPLLDAARAIARGFATRANHVPLTMGFGLYQGEKLGSQSERAYRRILNKALLPRVILRLEEQIRQSSGDPDYLYDALRVYLMLGSDEHYDPSAVQLWVTATGSTVCRARPRPSSRRPCAITWRRCSSDARRRYRSNSIVP